MTLQNATATFSQTHLVNASVNLAIDQDLDTGWAIARDASTNIGPETAVFETVSDTPQSAKGTRLVFVLRHTFSSPGDHALGRFRLLVTTAARSQFADGVDGTTTPGDVGAPGIWNVAKPVATCSSASANFTVLGDDSVLVADHNLSTISYAVLTETPLSQITGVRIEALEDPSLPHSGPGLQDQNGNFVLSELEVYAQPL